MHPIKFLLLVLAFTRQGDGHVYWEERVRELRLDECLRLLLPEVLLSREVRLIPETGNCSRDLTAYRRAIARRDHWAVKMLDSSSKMPKGLMQGNFVDLGMFDQCLDVVQDEIRGRHCMYSLYPAGGDENALPLHPTLSICLPASCDKRDVARLVNETISASDELKELGVKVGNTNCTVVESRTVSLRLIIFLLFLGSYIAFLGFCTYCDIVQSRGGTKLVKPHLLQNLVNFSMLKSTKAIFNLKTYQDSLPVIDGLRVLSNMGVIFVHVYLFQLLDLNSNVFFLQKWLPQLSAMGPIISVFCVDTFFVLTGFLTAYGFFKKMQQGKQPSVPRYYLHRYMRLTLPMLMTVFLTIELAPVLEVGPRHDFITGVLIKGCPSKLWSYFIYAHNYVKKDDMCLVHLWSLAVDMQLYWISPLIFYPLYKKPKIGLFILISLFLSSIGSTAALVWINKYSAIYIDQELALTRLVKTVSDIHITTITRASTWLLGAFFGYEVAQKNVKPDKTLLFLGWVLAFAAFAFVAWGIAIFTDVSYEYNANLEVTFAGLAKPAWAFGICWIIYASLHDFGGFITTILSSKFFLPLSRLAYGVYLTHPILPVMKLATTRTQNYFHQQFILFSFFEIMTTSLVFGFCFSVLFEMPMFVLENLIFKKQSKPPANIEKENKEK